ncbi:hypothetical protein GCM10026982_06320 [Nocardiopsis aegyptia]
MLAPEKRGNLARHTPEHEIGSVDNVPLTLDIARFGAVCAHDRLPSLFSRLPHPMGGMEDSYYETLPRVCGALLGRMPMPIRTTRR